MRVAIIALLASCTATAESQRESPALGFDVCDDVAAEGGWKNDFVPQVTSGSSYYIKATPIESQGRPIDAVIGFSNGPADAFADLGPIVRFNAQGFIDARNGGGYQAVSSFAYQVGTRYRFYIQLDVNSVTPSVDLPDPHTYDAWVWEDTPYADMTQIADNFAFRSEQASVARIDNVGRKVDSATGSVSLCNFEDVVYDADKVSSAGTGWNGTGFPAQTGHFRAEIEAEVAEDQVDAVIGLSHAMPKYFADLAAIARFNPAGYFDVRDGSTYRSDVLVPYVRSHRYVFSFDVDRQAKRYSVSVWQRLPMQTEPVVIASNYGFRTEQSSVSALAVMAQIVDSPQGHLYTDRLMISY